jgi:hypothetical protein
MTSGPGKQAHETYMKQTAGLRKDLAAARESLNTLLQKKPVDKQRVMQLVDQVNGLQSQLYKIATSTWIDVCGVSCADNCKCCKNPIVCIMMMSDQCPMKYCMQAMGCAKDCGCATGGSCTCSKGNAQTKKK